jgi:hypothetical protein
MTESDIIADNVTARQTLYVQNFSRLGPTGFVGSIEASGTITALNGFSGIESGTHIPVNSPTGSNITGITYPTIGGDPVGWNYSKVGKIVTITGAFSGTLPISGIGAVAWFTLPYPPSSTEASCTGSASADYSTATNSFAFVSISRGTLASEYLQVRLDIKSGQFANETVNVNFIASYVTDAV